jgi:serine/threonine protein kinase
MAIELSEFWNRLIRAGVADAAKCREIASRYRKIQGVSTPPSADSMARFLVQSDLITPFQSEAFLADQAVELRLGPYLIRDPQAASPLGRFAEAQRVTDGAIGVLLRSGTGNPWLPKHAAIDVPNLQPIQTQQIGDFDAVFSPIGRGKVLIATLTDQPWSHQSVATLAAKLAIAISAMHDANIVHGAIRADRIWLQDDGQAILLRDPSGPAVFELSLDPRSEHDGWLETIDDPALYLAPELTGDAPQLSPASDLYSLGCLLFRLATGRHPIRGSSTEQTRALHATEVPEELSAAIEQGEKGSPLFRVLAYALAKSPDTRFANAGQLVAAMTAVADSMPSPEPTAKLRSKDSPKRKQSIPPAAERVEPRKGQSDAQSLASAPAPVVESTLPVEKELPVQSDQIESDSLESDSDPPTFRVRRRRKSRAPWVLAGLAGVVVLQTITLMMMDPVQPVVKRRPQFVPPAVIPRVSNRNLAESTTTPTSPQSVSESEQQAGGFQVVQDQRLLYLPPTLQSQPITLDLLPPGPAMIVSLRLADIQNHAVGQSMLAAFSPELPTLIDSMISRLAVPAESVSRVTAAFHPGDSGGPQVSYSVTLSDPRPLDELLTTWDVGSAKTRDGQAIYVGDEADSDAFYLPADQIESRQISRFAVGAIDLITELASIDGQPIPLPRSLRSLWDATDQNADICVLVTPNFLFADGRSLLKRFVPEAIDPLRRVLIPNTSAVLLMAEADSQSNDSSQVYTEVRFSASGGITDASLAQSIRETIRQWPEWAETFLTDARPDDSWQALAQRLPQMIQYAADRVRVGVVNRMAVANVYLPSVAVPQLSLGTVLAMNTPMGGANIPAGSEGESLSIEQILDRPMSVSFGQESLEFAIDAILDSLGQQLPSGNEVPTIKIIGGDLQLMGITQNQQIRDFAKQDIPLRDVLTDLVVAANPDKSATGPADLKQSLIWVVVKESEDRQILVTTRQAAEAKKYELPPEFQTEN